MANKTQQVKVKATGNVIEVYKLKKGGWCDAKNCTTEYKDSEIEFDNGIK